VLGAQFHVVDRVAEIRVAHLVEPERLRVVRLDDDERDALLAIVRDERLDAAFETSAVGQWTAVKITTSALLSLKSASA